MIEKKTHTQRAKKCRRTKAKRNWCWYSLLVWEMGSFLHSFNPFILLFFVIFIKVYTNTHTLADFIELTLLYAKSVRLSAFTYPSRCIAKCVPVYILSEIRFRCRRRCRRRSRRLSFLHSLFLSLQSNMSIIMSFLLDFSKSHSECVNGIQ